VQQIADLAVGVGVLIGPPRLPDKPPASSCGKRALSCFCHVAPRFSRMLLYPAVKGPTSNRWEIQWWDTRRHTKQQPALPSGSSARKEVLVRSPPSAPAKLSTQPLERRFSVAVSKRVWQCFIELHHFGAVIATLLFPPKRQSFYHRSIIPRRLRPYFKGPVQLWRSLKTNDRDEATLMSWAWNARVQRVFVILYFETLRFLVLNARSENPFPGLRGAASHG
jgi:hypothetical protein